jgi:hypothetical protein
LKSSGDVGKGIWLEFQRLDKLAMQLHDDNSGISIIFNNTDGSMALFGILYMGKDIWTNEGSGKTTFAAAVFAHEFTHLRQGLGTAVSTMGEMDAYEVEYQIMNANGEISKLLPDVKDMHTYWHPDKFNSKDLINAKDQLKKIAQFSPSSSAVYKYEGFMSLFIALSNGNWVPNNGPYPQNVNSTRYYQDLSKSSGSIGSPIP